MRIHACLKCYRPVFNFHKYCSVCENFYKQDEDFWKRNSHLKFTYNQEAREMELELDKDAKKKEKERG